MFLQVGGGLFDSIDPLRAVLKIDLRPGMRPKAPGGFELSYVLPYGCQAEENREEQVQKPSEIPGAVCRQQGKESEHKYDVERRGPEEPVLNAAEKIFMEMRYGKQTKDKDGCINVGGNCLVFFLLKSVQDSGYGGDAQQTEKQF